MKHRVTILLTLLLGWAAMAQAQPPRFTRAVALNNHVGSLLWTSCANAASYTLFRRFPGGTYTPVATLCDTAFSDTLRRTLCADTVNYFVRALLPDTSLDSPSAGIFYQDYLPTAPCSLRTCSVDTALHRVRFSWYPSADTDILGYYICRGYPCMEFDTAWGRLNTSYLCDSNIDPLQPQRFRVLAFDSCFQASPLTAYYSYPAIQSEPIPCDHQHFRVSWQPYYNMPDSVKAYRLFYRFANDTQLRCHVVAPDATLAFDTVIDNFVVASVYCWLQVDSRNDSLRAWSLPRTFELGRADTASSVELRSAQFNAEVPSVTLTFAIDTAFAGDGTCLVERRPLADSLFEEVARLVRSGTEEQQFEDTDIRRTDSGYVYRIGVPDACGQWIKYSDTLSLLFPPVEAAAAFFPNVVLAGHPELGRFCPHYLSPLAEGYTLDIYNRLGIRCFHTDQLNQCWDGTGPDGSLMPQGTYVYHAFCRHADGTNQSYAGTVTLIKYE